MKYYKHISTTITLSILLIVKGFCCNVSFSSSEDPYTSGLFHFQVTGVNGVAPLDYSWDFGNEQTGEGASIQHLYTSTGEFNVCLTLSDNDGCIYTSCQEIEYSDSHCPEFQIEINVDEAGNLYGSIFNSEDINIIPETTDWFFQESNIVFETNPTFYLSPSPEPGTYVICIEYEYESQGDDCEDILCQTIQILDAEDNCKTSECVYPGDTDTDGSANMYDIFNIGIYYGSKGPERENISTDWQGQVSQDWGMQNAHGIDLKHSDCNGDGVIDQQDLDVIELNYDDDFEESELQASETDVPILLEFNEDSIIIDPNNPEHIQVSFELIIGSDEIPAADLYGFSTSFSFDEELILPGSFEIDFLHGSFFCDNDQILELSKEKSGGSVDISASRTNGISKSGRGVVAVVNFTIIGDLVVQRSSNTENQVPFFINIGKTNGIRNNGSIMPLNTKSLSLLLHVDYSSSTHVLKFDNSFQLSPNPNNGLFSLESTDEVIQDVNIYSGQGQLLRSMSIQASRHDFDLMDFPTGLYYIEVVNEQHTYVKKMIIH